MGFEPKTWRISLSPRPRLVSLRESDPHAGVLTGGPPGREKWKKIIELGRLDRHCEANTLPLSYTPKSALSRHLETQGFEPWTFCNVVCAATAHARLPGAPEVGLEPTTTRLRVLRSAD